MGRRIAGALLVLLACSLARIPPAFIGGKEIFSRKVAGSKQEPPGDSIALSGSLNSKSAKSSRIAPQAFILHPLRFLSFAPADSLMLIKGIGPVLADRIANARTGKGPFTSWNDLLDVRGIGPKKILKLKEQARRNIRKR